MYFLLNRFDIKVVNLIAFLVLIRVVFVVFPLSSLIFQLPGLRNDWLNIWRVIFAGRYQIWGVIFGGSLGLLFIWLNWDAAVSLLKFFRGKVRATYSGRVVHHRAALIFIYLQVIDRWLRYISSFRLDFNLNVREIFLFLLRNDRFVHVTYHFRVVFSLLLNMPVILHFLFLDFILCRLGQCFER
jgi:hypothetical protein